MPFAPVLPIETGVNTRGAEDFFLKIGLVASPNLVSASTVFSRLPFMLLSTSEFFI